MIPFEVAKKNMHCNKILAIKIRILSGCNEYGSATLLGTNVGDPHLHVLGPPESGYANQRYGSGSFPYLKKVLSRLK
jgi:hypothetical protein